MGNDSNIFGSGDNSLLERFVGILERQTDAKLSPNQLMGFLSLFNNLSALNLVQGSADAGIKDLSALNKLTSLAGQAAKTTEGSALKDSLMGLLGSQNQSGSDLGGLLNMVGGNKKINPQMLLTLLNLLNSQMGTRNDAKTEHPRIEERSREQAGEVAKEKDRGVELKYDKKKTS